MVWDPNLSTVFGSLYAAGRADMAVGESLWEQQIQT